MYPPVIKHGVLDNSPFSLMNFPSYKIIKLHLVVVISNCNVLLPEGMYINDYIIYDTLIHTHRRTHTQYFLQGGAQVCLLVSTP